MSTIAVSISPKLLELQTSNLVNNFVWVMPSWHTNNFPWKWVWPRSRDPTSFWHTIKHIFKTIWASDFKFGKRLWLTKCCYLTVRFCILDSPLWGSTLGYPSDSLASCFSLFGLHFAWIIIFFCYYGLCCCLETFRCLLLCGWFFVPSCVSVYCCWDHLWTDLHVDCAC